MINSIAYIIFFSLIFSQSGEMNTTFRSDLLNEKSYTGVSLNVV